MYFALCGITREAFVVTLAAGGSRFSRARRGGLVHCSGVAWRGMTQVSWVNFVENVSDRGAAAGCGVEVGDRGGCGG